MQERVFGLLVVAIVAVVVAAFFVVLFFSTHRGGGGGGCLTTVVGAEATAAGTKIVVRGENCRCVSWKWLADCAAAQLSWSRYPPGPPHPPQKGPGCAGLTCVTLRWCAQG